MVNNQLNFEWLEFHRFSCFLHGSFACWEEWCSFYTSESPFLLSHATIPKYGLGKMVCPMCNWDFTLSLPWIPSFNVALLAKSFLQSKSYLPMLFLHSNVELRSLVIQVENSLLFTCKFRHFLLSLNTYHFQTSHSTIGISSIFTLINTNTQSNLTLCDFILEGNKWSFHRCLGSTLGIPEQMGLGQLVELWPTQRFG